MGKNENIIINNGFVACENLIFKILSYQSFIFYNSIIMLYRFKSTSQIANILYNNILNMF